MAEHEFKQWVPWSGRLQVDGRHQAGVYLLGRFEGAPPTVVDPLGREIIYIGETHAQTLEKRWDQFHYCAFMGGTGQLGRGHIPRAVQQFAGVRCTGMAVCGGAAADA